MATGSGYSNSGHTARTATRAPTPKEVLELYEAMGHDRAMPDVRTPVTVPGSATGPTTDPTTVTAAAPRRTALRVLDAVAHRQTRLDHALNDGRNALKDARDRAFMTCLVMACLRHMGETNMVLDTFLKRRPKGRAKIVARVLQLGITQVLYMDVPGYAAASTSVELVREIGFAGHAKLVNAIMRRVADKAPAMIENSNSARLNTPDRLWDSWAATYGEDVATAIAQAHESEPPMDISLGAGHAVEYWAARLDATVLPTGTLRLNLPGAVENLDGYNEGAWWVQDAGAALPVRLMGDVQGKRVADLCAAPGGKTAQLASAGARVTALDRSEDRMKRLSQNMKRLSLKPGIMVTDATTWKPDHPMDGVLLDAPCSATGTIRRHPDVLLNPSHADVGPLVSLQRDLLHAAVSMVRPGGMIVYCTCSLNPQEGEEQITRFMGERDDAAPDPVLPHEVPGLADAIRPDGTVRTLPHMWAEHGGIDGFYVARLRKKGS